MASGIAGACQDYGHGHWSDALITGANLTNVTLRGGGFMLATPLLHPLVPRCLFGNASDAGWIADDTAFGTLLTAGSETCRLTTPVVITLHGARPCRTTGPSQRPLTRAQRHKCHV